MKFSIGDLLQVIGALAFFIYGMKMMSDGVQRAAGSQMRNILRTMTKNRYLGVFTGFLTTALLQSSSATTVMTVSFVNAGLLSLFESAGVMMGANIGTTITGWLVSILGFKVKLSMYSIPIFAAAVPMLFSSKGKTKYWGEFLIGFAILFLGLNYLKESVPNIKDNPEVLSFLKEFGNYGFLSRLLFVVVGTLITIIVQSSSAAMAITLTMCSQGWLPFDIAAAMILGENIGTTITAELASVVGNVNARRSARIHSLFNIIGVTWMILIMPFFLKALSTFVQFAFGVNDPFTSAADMPIGLSAFHTAFNLTNVLLLIGFVPLLVKLAVWSVKSKGDDDEIRLKFINTSLKSPELGIIELQKETAHFGDVVAKMAKFSHSILNSVDSKYQRKMHKKLSKYEKITDEMEIEIIKYITELSQMEMTERTSIRLRSIVNICNDLERIGDLFFQFSKLMEAKSENKTYFLPEQRANLIKMVDILDKAFIIMNSNLSSPSYGTVNIKRAKEVEKEINQLRDILRDENNSLLGTENYNINAAMIYNNLFSLFEKIGDHIMNVNESIVGEI